MLGPSSNRPLQSMGQMAGFQVKSTPQTKKENNIERQVKKVINKAIEEEKNNKTIVDLERILKEKHNFNIPKSENNGIKTLEIFLSFIEQIVNSQNTHFKEEIAKLAIDSSVYQESCKQVLSYLGGLKSKSQLLLEQSKLHSDMSKNDLQQEVIRLRQKLKEVENVKKDELLVKLALKEQECLAFKAKIDKIQVQGADLFLDVPQTSMDIEYQSKINDQIQEFTKAQKFLNNLIEDALSLESNHRKNSDQDFETQQQQLRTQINNQLDKIKGLHDQLLDENSNIYNKKQEQETKLQSALQNVKFLENKLSSTLTQKEEQVIKLKSEIVIYKNKINIYKSKLKDSVSQYETKKITEIQTQKDEIIQQKNKEIDSLKFSLDTSNEQIENLQQQIEELKIKMQQESDNYCQQIHQQNIIITELSDKIQGIDKDYTQQLTKVDQIRENTQKRLNIEEKERTLNSLKLEYLVNNYRKLDLQKQFLVKTLDKDMKNLINEMRKSEVDIQKDVYISSQLAQSKLTSMYQIIKDSLKYIKDVISFMNFDIEQIQINQEPSTQHYQMREMEENSLENKNTNNIPQQQHKISKQSVPQLQKDNLGKQKIHSLDQCFHKHIYELSEVILSVLCEFYKESRTQTSIELVSLFDMLQNKTNKAIVQEIYNKFFAQNRIHFAQYLNKINEKTFDLEAERNDLKNQLQKLNRQLQESSVDSMIKIGGKEEEIKVRDENQQIEYQEVNMNADEEFKEIEHQLELMPRTSLDFAKNHQKLQQDINQYQKHQTMVTPTSQNMDRESSQPDLSEQSKYRNAQNSQIGYLDTVSRSSPAAVATALQKSQEKRLLDMIQVENMALKERVREVRLHMQRQISDLQEKLKNQKDQHQGELNKLKLEYGKDLALMNKTSKNKEEQLKQDLEVERIKNVQEIEKIHDQKLQNLITDFDIRQEDLRRKLEKCEIMKTDIERELKKIKKQSILGSQGGWGTFSIVFEDNPKKHHPLVLQSQNSQREKNSIDSIQSIFAKKLLHSQLDSTIDSSISAMDKSVDDNITKEDITLEKIQHFIEVGFLMDQKNFKHIDTYKEKTFDSSISKFLFEFQDPLDNFKMINLQNKMKQQLYENFALFNEINPIYVTLNMGRNVSPFWDESISQENFKLIKREGYYLGETYLMVNFLKCDDPPNPLVIRVIAFENESCYQHSFDLTFEDLMFLVDGNIKLLEEEHNNDLCQLIMNNLTIIKRKNNHASIEIEGNNDNQNKFYERKKSKLANSSLAVEHKIFFNEYYRNEYERNKVIIAKHDKRKRGLNQSKSIGTDFDKSIVYEAFDTIYQDNITFSQSQNIAIQLLRGNMSEHMILKVKIGEHIQQELCLYQTELSKMNQTQSLTSEIIRINDNNRDDIDSAHAYVISFEKIYGLENYIIRIVQLSKYDDQTMKNYEWDPNMKNTFGSLKYEEQNLFLIRKNNREYMRILQYDFINTEIRSLLFMHSYGFCQSLIDFGKLKPLQSINIKMPLEKISYNAMSMIYRDFGIVRIKTQTKNYGSDQENDDEDEDNYQYENQFALYAFYEDYSCLSKGEIFLYIRVHELQIDLNEKLDINETLSFNEISNIKEDKENLCQKIFDKVVVVNIENKYYLEIDNKIQPMKEVIEQIKQQKFQAQINDHDLIESEIDGKSLGVTLNMLAESSKTTQVSIINKKVFKITAYFLNNLKNLKLQTLAKKVFDWQLIYIEAQTRKQNKSLILAITEKDINEILSQLKAKQHGNVQLINDNEILNSKISKDKILEFILDSMIFDDSKQQLRLSISYLKNRTRDRLMMHQQFKLTGGKFYQKLGQIEDTDFSIYQTSIPQLEMSKKLIMNQEKEFSDKKYDIKIYEIKVKHKKNEKKYIFEMFSTEQPSVIFRAQFISQAQQQGKKLMIERFNVIQQQHQDFEENKFIRDGMVIAILEQSFPHSLTFMLLEPVSHMHWQYVIQDDKLNPIESRLEKEYFVKQCRANIEHGLFARIYHEKIKTINTTGYQKDGEIYEDQDLIEQYTGSLKNLFNDKNNLIYAREVEVVQGLYAEISIVSEAIFDSLKLIVKHREETQAEISFILDVFRESSRFLTGYISITNKVKLLYTIETSCAYTQQERGIRIILREPSKDKKVLDLILAEKHLIDNKSSLIKDDIKIVFNTGFKDSYALFQKLPDFITDFKKAFLEPEKRLKFEVAKDTSKLLYRKVINFLGKTFILFLKYDSIEQAEKEWKVILFDQFTQYEESYIFQTSQILSKDELQTLNFKNDRIMRDIVTTVVEKRLKIKQIEDKFQIVKSNNEGEKITRKRYLVFFTEPPSQIQDKKELHNFDIRSGFRYSLTNPESIIPDSDSLQQERLLAQLEKDDLLFDVNEILNPYELILRVKTYEKETLKVISVSDMKQPEIRKELAKDRVSYLLEPHKREDLAKYLVQNMYYDEVKKRIFFLQSEVQ